MWFVGLIASIPLAVRLIYIDDASICTIRSYAPSKQFAYASCYTSIGWLIPGIILATLYFKTANQLRASEEYHSHTKVMQQQIRRENKEVVKMFVVVVALFFLLTLPNAVYQVVYHYFYMFKVELIRGKSHLGQLYIVLPCVSAMNSCINPLVYAKMHREVNRYLHGLFGKLRRFACSQNIHQSDTVSTFQQESTQLDIVVNANALLAKQDIDTAN